MSDAKTGQYSAAAPAFARLVAAPPFPGSGLRDPQRLCDLGHPLAGLQALDQNFSTPRGQAGVLMHVVPLAGMEMMSGDFSFLPRSEGNNLLKPHS